MNRRATLKGSQPARRRPLATRLSLADSVVVAAKQLDIVKQPAASPQLDEPSRRRARREVVLEARHDGGLGRFRAHPDVVTLVQAIATPRRLGDVVSAPFNSRIEEVVAKLILDGFVKVRVDGEFVSGAAAFDCLYGPPPSPKPNGPCERLSLRAAEYGEQLLPRRIGDLAGRLYRYNSIPAGPRWSSRLSSFTASRDYLAIDAPVIARAGRSHHWALVADPTDDFPWFAWTARSAAAHTMKEKALRARAKPRPMFKLYVSVRPEHARAALHAVAPELFRSPAIAFKIGAGVHGVLRPDRMVAYFWSYEGLAEIAGRLRTRLAGLPAHGVPLTASLGADGALSWAIDPPAASSENAVMRRQSWRLAIAGRLAGALTAAGALNSAKLSASRFALARLRLDGIDLLDPDPASAVQALLPLRVLRS